MFSFEYHISNKYIIITCSHLNMNLKYVIVVFWEFLWSKHFVCINWEIVLLCLFSPQAFRKLKFINPILRNCKKEDKIEALLLDFQPMCQGGFGVQSKANQDTKFMQTFSYHKNSQNIPTFSVSYSSDCTVCTFLLSGRKMMFC